MGLQATNLRKTFRKRTVVDDVSLGVERGEIVGLLGPNGAGKTTSFYMIVGILRPDKGRVELDSADITSRPIHTRSSRGLGYLAQEPSVFRKMTVAENITAALELKHRDRSTIRQRLEELIMDFNLERVRGSYGYALSGGERRRVEIARCLATDPGYILLDEPFAGIDPISVADIQDMIFRLRDMNIGILITDHNVRETLKITNRAYIISEGSVLTHGSPEEIVRNEKVIEKYLGKGFQI